jgi:MFS family permease
VIDHHPPWVMWGHPRARERAVVGAAIGQILSFAVAVAVSPIPIIGVVLMLATPRARSNGPAFLIGWIAGLAILGTVVLLVSSGANASDNGQPKDWVSILKLVLGVLLLMVAVRQWRGRPRGDEQAELPKWMRAIDTFTAPKALAMGAVLAAANPKNGLLTIGAAAAIAGTGISAGQQAGALAVFIAIGTLGVAAPIVVYFALGSRSAKVLEEMKDWMAANNAAIMTVLLLVIGAKLIGDGISGLSA